LLRVEIVMLARTPFAIVDAVSLWTISRFPAGTV